MVLKETNCAYLSKRDDCMEYTEEEYLMISGIQHLSFAGGSGR